MMSAISLHDPNKPSLWLNMYAYTLKKNLGLSLLYFIITFLCMPFVLIIQILQEVQYRPYQVERYIYPLEDVYPSLLVVAFILAAIGSLVACLVIFHYLSSKKAMDVYGALPIKRTSLFASRYFAGLTLLAVPMILSMGITFGIMQVSDLYTVNTVLFFQYSLMFLLCFLTCYTFTAFIIHGSGTVFDSIVSLIIFGGAGPILYLIFKQVMGMYLFGADTSMEMMEFLSPYASAAQLIRKPADWNVFWWIFLTIGFFAGGILLARFRKSEKSETPYVFRGFPILIKACCAAMAGMLGGFLFKGIFEGQNFTPLIAGFILFSLLTYVILEIIISRGFKRLLKSLPLYGAVLALFFASVLGIHFGGPSYETRLPKPENIQSISLSENGEESDKRYYETESIEAIYELYETIIDHVKKMRENGHNPGNSHYITDPSGLQNEIEGYYYSDVTHEIKQIDLSLHMKNGTTISRSYQVETGIIAEPYAKVKALKEYKLNKSIFKFKLTGNEYQIDFVDLEYNYVNLGSLSRASVEEFIACYKEDYMEETYEDLAENQDAGETIFICGINDYNPIEVEIYPHYTRTQAFLKKCGLSIFKDVNQEDVNSIYVCSDWPPDVNPSYFIDYFYTLESDVGLTFNYAKVSEPKQMGELLSAVDQISTHYEQGDYLIRVMTDNGNYSVVLKKEDAPAFLKDLNYSSPRDIG